MQIDIQTFKHWTAASKPNSWLLGLATSQPDNPLPTGGSQIFLGDPQSHRTLVIWTGASLWFWGTSCIFHPSGLPGVEEAACLGQWKHGVASLLLPWIGRRTGGPRPRISRVLTMLIACQEPGSGYIRLPAHFSIFFPSKFVRTPEVFLREFILMNWISQDVYGLKNGFTPICPQIRMVVIPHLCPIFLWGESVGQDADLLEASGECPSK